MIAEGTSLTADERQLLARAAELLRQRLATDLHAVWLFGSRARGETPSHGDSDVDVLVLVSDASWDGKREVRRACGDAARELRSERVGIKFSVHVHTPDWLADRRAIKSFFIGEIDRDKVVIEGTG
jgi:predicted nucleotidyltransferase